MREKLFQIIFLPLFIAASCIAFPSYAYADNGDVNDWATLMGYLADINGTLDWIYYDITPGSVLNDAVSNIDDNMNTVLTYVNTIKNTLVTIQTYTGNINDKVGTVINSLAWSDSDGNSWTIGKSSYSIYSILNREFPSGTATTSYTNIKGLLRYILNYTSTTASETTKINTYLGLNVANPATYSVKYWLKSIDTSLKTLVQSGISINVNSVNVTGINNLIAAFNREFASGELWDDFESTKGAIFQLLTSIGNLYNTLLTTNSLIGSNSASPQTNSIKWHLIQIKDALDNLSIDVPASPNYTNALSGLTTAVNDVTDAIGDVQGYLLMIQGQLDRILLYLVVSDVQDDLIGDFDWVGVGNEISTLGQAASNKMPFAAFGFLGSLTGLAIFSSTPSQLPEIAIPFNFAGSNQTLTISNAMMNQAQPYIHFAVLLMFMYCLAVVTMRFIYRD